MAPGGRKSSPAGIGIETAIAPARAGSCFVRSTSAWTFASTFTSARVLAPTSASPFTFISTSTFDSVSHCTSHRSSQSVGQRTVHCVANCVGKCSVNRITNCIANCTSHCTRHRTTQCSRNCSRHRTGKRSRHCSVQCSAQCTGHCTLQCILHRSGEDCRVGGPGIIPPMAKLWSGTSRPLHIEVFPLLCNALRRATLSGRIPQCCRIGRGAEIRHK
jgi:hypothetical protein